MSEPEMPVLTREDKIKMLEDYITDFERLPPHAQFSFATHADIAGVLMIILSILREK